jgi:hypothetical protein
MAEDAGGSRHRKGQLPIAAHLALLDAIRQGRANDTQHWERLERAVQTGAGVRVERAIVQLGPAMGDIIDALGETLESVGQDPLMERATEDAAALMSTAR